MDERYRGAGKSCDANSGGERQPRTRMDPLHRPEAHHGADEHHPLDAEVQDAGALREQLAERGEEQRRPVEHGRGEHDDEDRVVHVAASGTGRRARDARRIR